MVVVESVHSPVCKIAGYIYESHGAIFLLEVWSDMLWDKILLARLIYIPKEFHNGTKGETISDHV